MVRQALGDRYTVDREIAAGGAARVFFARDQGGRAVALKVLRPELLPSITAQRFLREISVLQKLDHPLIARLLDYGEAGWFLYYVMEYVDGPTLRQYLDQHKQAPIEPTLRGSRELLDAVAHAHANGIMHRDVKPENIVLAPRGAILLDFGIARAVQVSEGDRVTRSGFTVGTSHYMSPEQAAGSAEIDHRSDLYSLGCVLFESLAGRPPYQHQSEAALLELHQKAAIPDVREFRREVSKPLAKVLAKTLAKAPKDRWQSASQLKAALEKLTG